MSTVRVITRNIASNWLGYAIQVAITFFLTPYILREIGDVRYGIWAIVVSLTGYYGLLDLGFRAGMTQYITRYFSTGEFLRMNQAASSGLVLHGFCAFCVLLAATASALLVPSVFSLSGALANEAVWCIVIVGGSTAIQFLLFPLSVGLTAKQRFDIVTAIGLFSRILSAGAVVWSLSAGLGLIGICLASAAGNILDYGLRWAVARQLLPELRFSLQLVNWSSCHECMGFGFWSAVLAASTLIISFTDALVIGIFMPISAVAFFALANNLVRYFANIFVPVSQVFFPAATALDALDDVSGLQRLYLTASRMISLQIVSIGLIAHFWASDFYLLWVGEKYLTGSLYHSVPLIFQVLLVGAMFAAAQGIGSKVLLGRRAIRGLAWLFVVEGISNLTLSIVLIPYLGLLGVALGTMIPAVVCKGILHPLMVCANLELRTQDYFREILWPATFVGVLLAPLFHLLHQIAPRQHWANLVLSGIAAFALAVLVICCLGLTPSDRQRFLYPALRRLASFRPPFPRARQNQSHESA